MMKTTLIFALFLAATATASAEPYRCNVNGQVVYQETPCYLTARPADRAPPAAASAAPEPATQSAGPIEAGKQLCRSQASSHVAWKDPESVRIGSVYGGQMTVIDLGSVKTSGRQFFVDINAKNSYGGYVGQKPLVCYTSQDGTRIVKVDSLLIN